MEEMKEKAEFTKWKTAPGSDNLLQPPKDHLFEAQAEEAPASSPSRASVSSKSKQETPSGHNYSLEPQRIRVFNIKYGIPDDMNLQAAIKESKAAAAAAAQKA